MGHRLSRITTRTGDDGSTGLADGTRLVKTAPRIVAMGDVDELNCQIGLTLTEDMPSEVRTLWLDIQQDLFDLGAELAVPDACYVRESALTRLDEAIIRYNASLPALAEFILPGGCRVAAQVHIVRSVARRAERSVVVVLPGSLAARYLNRLSDLAFILARVLNRGAQVEEACWQPKRPDVSTED